MNIAPFSFIGRADELSALERLHQSPGSHIVVVYGRRRIGKTALIHQAFSKAYLLSFEGLENKGKKQQLSSFLFQLTYHARAEQKNITINKTIKHWREAFIQLMPLVQNKKVVILLDELQWMANYRSDLISDLKMIWEQYLSPSAEITLVLCGSIASFMEHKVVKSKALYGRTDLMLHLKAFLLSDSRCLLKKYSREDVMLAQLIVGGIPKYLTLLDEQPSIAMGLDSLAFSENGFLSEEFERIFVSHFGQSGIYHQVITLLAKNAYGLSRMEIQDKLTLQSGGELTRNLYNLESAGFIASFIPFDQKSNSRTVRFLISDPFIRFYFTFLLPYKKKGIFRDNYFTNFVSTSAKFRSWLGRSFELLCLQHKEKIAQRLGFSGIEYSAGPYFQHGKRGVLQGAQLDLVFDRADRVLTLCEIKYRESSTGTKVIKEVEEKISRIPQFANRSLQKVLITKSEPSSELRRSSYFSHIITADELIVE
ncbi:MAG: ATP-binding protein [Pseudomonadales bacterium]